MARSALEEALRWSVLAAKSALHHGFGWLVSQELEAGLLEIAQRLPGPLRARAGAPAKPARWLHVLDQAYETGGHTALVRRWVEFDPAPSRHSVLLLAQRFPIPPGLTEAVQGTGGSLWALPPDAPLLERAAQLRSRAWNDADRVVLHIHPYSVIPTVALGIEDGPPVALLNHLSQKFWVGGSVADLVLNLRESAATWSRSYRGITRNSVLPIPVAAPAADAAPATSETRQIGRRALGLPAEATVLLTIGNEYKYRPLPDLDFLEAAEAILRACPHTYLVAVGPRQGGRWAALAEATKGRLVAAGPRRDLVAFQRAADVYIEGFPVGSPTALLEVGLLGTPCVRAPQCIPPPFVADGAALIGVRRPVEIADYVRSVITLIKDEGERRRQGAALAAAIRAHHTQPAWPQHLRDARNALPGRHGIYSLTGALPLPENICGFSVALATLGHAEDTLSFTLRAALAWGLRAKVDGSLARTLMTRCLAGDPRLLARRRIIGALAKSVIGHRLADTLRRAGHRLRG